MTVEAGEETFGFEAEVAQILDLMAHSLYSNKEIFLRELVSNASDAIDRLRFERFSRPDLEPDGAPPRITVGLDAAARTITIADNGIGMSRAEVRENIGTIARSGTAEFLRSLTGDRRADVDLIGQFGVGFYSAFVVAERVELTTRRAGLPAGDAVRWESDGRGAYTLRPAERAEHGTTIVLHLRESEGDLLNAHRLRSIVQKYSDHIAVPIHLAGEGEGDEDEPVNRASALWTRPRGEITETEYAEYYRHLTGDFTDPLAHLHAKVEGRYEYTLLLYLPSRAPYDLWARQARQGVRLHVQRVFILEDTERLLPGYLRFARGVVDSADLPLNVSRELLQGSLAVEHIRSTATKRVLRLLADLAEKEPEKYAAFWTEFGAILKEGVADDYSHRDEIAELLRFPSTRGEAVSLREYAGRMRDGQDKIYYLLAPNAAGTAPNSPHLEAFRAKGIEVLLLGEAVDTWVVTGLPQGYDGHPLQSVAQGAPDFGDAGDEDGAAAEQASADHAGLVERLREALDGRAAGVRTTSRLTTSPACIVADEADTEIALVQRLRGSGLPARPILELNPGHPLVARLNARRDDPRLADWAHVLFDQAVLTFGAAIEDPAAFVERLNGLLVSLTGDGTPEEAPAE